MASDRGKQHVYCKVCSKHFSVSHGGIDNVHRHWGGKKHLELFNARKSTNQVTKYYVSSNSSSLDENVIKAETLISVAMAKHYVPLAFVDHLAKVVKEAFPDSSIAKKYACGRGKTTLRILIIILKRFQSCFIHILANRAHAKFEVKNKSFRALSRIFFFQKLNMSAFPNAMFHTTEPSLDVIYRCLTFYGTENQ